MNPYRHFIGVFGVLGTWSHWEGFFDLTRRGIRTSFLAVAASLPPLFLICYGIMIRRAELMGVEPSGIAVIPFLIIAALVLLAFPLTAWILGNALGRVDGVRPWIITRHWAVLLLALVMAGLFGLNLLGVFPTQILNGVAFAAWLGLLAIDIRLAKRAGGFGWGASIMIGCVSIVMALCLLWLGVSELGL